MPLAAFCIMGTRQTFLFWKEVSDKVFFCRVYSLLLESNFSTLHYKKDPTIRGIQVGQKEIKITQYADDTTVLVPELDSVSQLMKLLSHFKNISGLEVNKHKTEAMWLGSWRNYNEKPFGFKWPITQFTP